MMGTKNPPDETPRGNGTRSTPGLSALDADREASMADEGGASGMAVEHERPDVYIDEIVEPGLGFDLMVVGSVFVLGALAGLLLGKVLGRD
jgi:hypothetical protein